MQYVRERLRRLSLKSNREPNLSPPPPLPALPDERPRPLTATTPDVTVAVNSSFYQILPYEIRRRIIVEAFGERTLHLDLRLEHPLKKDDKLVNSLRKRHANMQLFNPLLRDTTQRRRWTWWSCICHRSRRSGGSFDFTHPTIMSPGDEPARDHCRDCLGLPMSMCEYRTGDPPDKCFVGAMGWLLTCRQAYIDGVDVLYSTNIFHFAYAELVISLPRLLRPQRLAAIKKVEILWGSPVKSGRYRNGLYSENTSDVEISEFARRLPSLAYLPQVLPQLRYLHLSFKHCLPRTDPTMAIWSPEMYDETEKVLCFVDTVVVRMSQLLVCYVALPSSVYETRKMREKGQGIAWTHSEQLEPEALWRDISISDTGSESSGGSGALSGYWIVHGHVNMDVTHCSCPA